MMPYAHVNLTEREVIKKMRDDGKSFRAIAEILGRAPSTISREYRRNSDKWRWYRPKFADNKSKIRRKESKQRKLDKYPELKALILYWLKNGISPDVIAGRLRWLLGESIISHESIYTWVYKEAEEGNDFYKFLPRSVKKRHNRLKTNKNRLKIPNRVSIHDRPEEIEDRKTFGHWEGDTVVGKGQSGYIATVVERKTRLLASGFMKDKRADTCNRAILEAFAYIPNSNIKSITFDNGSEFFHHEALQEALESNTFFADPYSSWQRGTNENTNGILRRFFPKNMDFSNLTQEDVDKVVHKINSIPRKSLGYRTPYEAFFSECGVALQT
jgi:IS30 family transposase